jgi:geranylgeranyl reductase family protein
MDSMIEVAIVGGGPAGSYCAYCLAENGIYPTIFDHSHPREKPCGGMISPLAQELFPFLKELPIEHTKRKIRLIAPSGREMSLKMRKGVAVCISRLEFDQFLLNMALSKGAKLLKEKVTDIEKQGNFWKIKTDKNLYVAEKLVGADGVNSIVRQKVTVPLRNADKGLCYGYFVEDLESEEISFHFLPHRKGYIWVIPRKRVSSVGIGCVETSHLSLSELRKELDTFIVRHYPEAKIISKWAALIPNIKDVKTLYSPVAGKTWIVIGDAAGHVNPISGEGIPYALLSGELAAQAIAENNLQLFEKLWRQTYGLNLLLAVKLRKWIYKRPILECYCRYLKFKVA